MSSTASEPPSSSASESSHSDEMLAAPHSAPETSETSVSTSADSSNVSDHVRELTTSCMALYESLQTSQNENPVILETGLTVYSLMITLQCFLCYMTNNDIDSITMIHDRVHMLARSLDALEKSSCLSRKGRLRAMAGDHSILQILLASLQNILVVGALREHGASIESTQQALLNLRVSVMERIGKQIAFKAPRPPSRGAAARLPNVQVMGKVPRVVGGLGAAPQPAHPGAGA